MFAAESNERNFCVTVHEAIRFELSLVQHTAQSKQTHQHACRSWHVPLFAKLFFQLLEQVRHVHDKQK